jgi:hypothetical protein
VPSTGVTVFVAVLVVFATLVVVALVAVIRGWVQSFDETEIPKARPSGGADYGEGEDALVPVGPPKQPTPSAAVALPLREPKPETVEAYGRELPDQDTDADALAG